MARKSAVSNAVASDEALEVEMTPERGAREEDGIPVEASAASRPPAPISVNEEASDVPAAPDAETVPVPAVAPSEEEPETETLLFSGVCPLCWTSDIVNPVLLHGSVAKRASMRDTVLVACRECAEKWTPALRSRRNGAAGDAAAGLNCPFCAHTLDVPAQPHEFEALIHGDKLKSMRFCNPITSTDGKPTLFSLAAAKERNSAPCGICEEPGASIVCVQCDFALCDRCEASTHGKGKFKKHERIPFDCAVKRQQLKCPAHPSHTLDLFCQTCAECVCISCCFGGDAHKGHDVAQLAEVAASAAEELRRTLHTLHDTAKAAGVVQSKTAALVPAFEACVDHVERDIKSSFAALRDALATREKSLLTQLHDARRERGADIDACISVGGCLAAQLEASAAAMEESLRAADAVTLLRLRESLSHAATSMDASTVTLLRGLQSAESGLRARLDTTTRSSPSAAGRIASFYLLSPQESSEVAVKKYKDVFQTMGQLTTASQLPTEKPHSAAAPRTRTASQRSLKSQDNASRHSSVGNNEESDDGIDGADSTTHHARTVASRAASVPPSEPVARSQPQPVAPAPLPRLFATMEELPRPVAASAVPAVASEREVFRFTPLNVSTKAPPHGSAESAAASALALDWSFGSAGVPSSTRRTEAHTLSRAQPLGSSAFHSDSAFAFSKARGAVGKATTTTPTGWDVDLKLASKRFAPLDANFNTELPVKRARLSLARDENNGSALSSSNAPLPGSGSSGNLQLRL